jgi:hypothetical protein
MIKGNLVPFAKIQFFVVLIAGEKATATAFALLLLILSSPATAASQMPTELLGDWCRIDAHADTEIFGRKCKRKNNYGMQIIFGGYVTKDTSCKVEKVTQGRAAGLYHIEYQCRYVDDTERKDRPLKQSLRLLTNPRDLSAAIQSIPELRLSPTPTNAAPLLVIQPIDNPSDASAQIECTVSDPTGTPLNVRSRPNGPKIGALHNQAHVLVFDLVVDIRSRRWAKIVPMHEGRAGWVFRDYLTCEKGIQRGATTVSPAPNNVTSGLQIAIGSEQAPQITPKIKQGMSYRDARAIISSAGWQASVFKKTILDNLDRALQEWFVSAGFMEIMECSPTGNAFCVAEFHDQEGKRKLYVFTTSGSLDEMKYQGVSAPEIVSFCINKKTVNCN